VEYIAAVGAVLYGVLRLSYVFFYVHLRATPEEAGYGYAEVLANQLVGAVWLVLIISVPVTLLIWVVRLASSRRKVRTTTPGPAQSAPGTALRSLRRTALWSTSVTTLAVLLGLPVIAWSAGTDAAQGLAVRSMYLLGTLPVPILAVQAVPAHVTWEGIQSEAARTLESRQCLLYLGRADGTAVFYDVQSRESLRLPTEHIIIALDFTTGVPLGCEQ
jgi:hypothetical protein